MSLSGGNADTPFAPLSGEETKDLGQFNDIEVYGNIYLKEATDQYTGYNVPLITTEKTNDNMIFNTTTLSSNWDFTVGTGQDTKESIFRINPTTGLNFETNNNPINIDWNELSYLNGARSNLQTQLDNLSPDLSSNQGYWGNFWNSNTITNSSANAINTVAFPTADPNNYGFSVSNSNRIVAGTAGIYMFVSTIQINKSQGSTTEEVFFWIRQNGVDIPDTAYKESIKAEPVLSTANWQLKMNAGDYFQLMWSSSDIHVQLVSYAAGTTPTKPAIPSVILTVSQVSYLVSGGAGMLPLTYNSTTKNLLCDASFQVVGNTDLSGNRTYVRGNLDLSGNVSATGSFFSYTRNIEAITVQNALWTDGSGTVPTGNNPTTMFTNVKNQSLTLYGWTWNGTAISTINGFGAVWVGSYARDYNNYSDAIAGQFYYYVFFECFSPGTNQNNSTFYFQKELTLDKGFYVAEWYSYWGAGNQYTTTSLSVSVGSGPALLTYNDSATRGSLTWQKRSLVFEVKTSGNNPLRWTYKDTQATSNIYFNASVAALKITKYNGVIVSDASYSSLISGSLCNLNNASLIGTNSINGTLTMTGIPSIYSSKGVNNICISTPFTSAAAGGSNSQNIAIGSGLALYAESFTDCIMLAQNAMTDVSQQQKTATQSIAIGNDIRGAGVRDILIGYSVRKSFDISHNDCVMVGWGIGTNATSITPHHRATALGSTIWRGYYSGTATRPVENVAVGYAVQGQAGFFGSFCTAVGALSQTWLAGNATTAAYNTSIGYYSGVDPQANNNGAYRQSYVGGTYLGAWARSRGDIAGILNATAIGYNTSTDASYCTVIGADASYNVQNTIRLGRPIDRTVASHLTVNGNTILTGNTTVGNLNITGTTTGLSFIDLSLTGNLAVGGRLDVSGNLNLTGQINSTWLNGQFTTVSNNISAVDTKANNAQNRADDAYNLAASAQSTATAAAAVGATNATAIVALTATVAGQGATIAGLEGTVATQGSAISTLQGDMTAQQGKTQYMLSVDAGTSSSQFYNNVKVFPSAISTTPGIYLSPTATSTFANGLECKTISTTAGEVQNLRGATVNIGDAAGAVNIDSSNVSIGNVASSTITIGNASGITTNVYGAFSATGNSITLGNAGGATNVNGLFAANGNTNVIGAINAGTTTTINGETLSIATGLNNTITIGNASSTSTTIWGDLSCNGVNTTLGGTGSGSTTKLNGNNISIGTGTNSKITIGNGLFTTTEIQGDLSGNGYNTILGNANSGSTTTLRGANISIGGLSSTIYINGLLYIPFNPTSFAQALAQWT